MRKEIAIELVHIAEEQYEKCNFVGWSMGKMASAYENAIVFTKVDMYTFHPYQNKTLYMENAINEYLVRRTFIDDGCFVNFIPLSTLKAVNIDLKNLRLSYNYNLL